MKKYVVKADDNYLNRLRTEYAYFDCSVKRQGEYAVIERLPTDKQKERVKKEAERIKQRKERRRTEEDGES